MKVKAREAFGEHFCNGYKINIDSEYDIEWVEALDLFVPQRLDLIIKYKYVESIDRGYNTTFFEKLYEAHIGAFSNGTFTEIGQESTKNSIDKYISSFKKLVEDIKINGLDPKKSVIPVGCGNGIMDGSHRVAIAAYFNKKVPIIRFDNFRADNGAVYFEKNYLEKKYIEYSIYQYAILKDDVSAFVLWPRVHEKPLLYQKALELLKNVEIVYHSVIPTDINLLRNFMIRVYSGFEWLGAIKNGFAGASRYAEQCFALGGNIELFVVEGCSSDQRLKIKEKIRSLYGLGNSSIHSTDNKKETISVLRMLLNENSRHFLKHSKPDKYKNFNEMVTQFRAELDDQGNDPELFALDSGAVLAGYGLRDTSDIDYISNQTINSNHDFIEKHDMNNYYLSIDEIIANPDCHFYYYGLKFVSLKMVRNMKESRYSFEKNSKDREDILLIDSIKDNMSVRDIVSRRFIPIKRSIHNFEKRIEHWMVKSVIFKPARYVYHKIKGTPYHG